MQIRVICDRSTIKVESPFISRGEMRFPHIEWDRNTHEPIVEQVRRSVLDTLAEWGMDPWGRKRNVFWNNYPVAVSPAVPHYNGYRGEYTVTVERTDNVNA
jgi:hypothetical protein